MAPLDGLYNEGTSSEFRAAAATSHVEEIQASEEMVRVNVAWGWHDAVMKIDCTSGNVHFLTLNSGSAIPTGLYTQLCLTLPSFFRDRGVLTFTASPTGPKQERVLKKRGKWTNDVESRYLIWEL